MTIPGLSSALHKKPGGPKKSGSGPKNGYKTNKPQTAQDLIESSSPQESFSPRRSANSVIKLPSKPLVDELITPLVEPRPKTERLVSENLDKKGSLQPTTHGPATLRGNINELRQKYGVKEQL